jgi:uncharacterized protein (TIGR00251 family)
MAAENNKGVVVTVHVLPKASCTECVGQYGDALKIRVAAPPVDGAANEELIRFIAERCSIPRTAVHIQSGQTGRRKRVRLDGITAQSAMARLLSDAKKGRLEG